MAKTYSAKQWTSAEFEKHYLSGIAIDTVIFGFHEGRLKVLLLQYKNTSDFALPGGLIKKTEDLHQAAKRSLGERTGLKDIYLQQFQTFGSMQRIDNSFARIMKARGMKPEKDHFLLRRFISVGYYALVDINKVVPKKDDLADDCSWYELGKIPPLIQDHKVIIMCALDTLRKDLDAQLAAFNLMPETFTMGELQQVYETILDKPMLRTSFQRKILAMDIVKKVAVRKSGGAHKAPFVYKFKPK